MPTATAPDPSTLPARAASALRGRASRVAFVGAGYIADVHVAALRAVARELAAGGSPAIDLIAACDVDRAKAERFARKHGIGTAFGSVDQLLAEGRPDAVHVIVPPHLHARVAEPILRAGVHVLLEKPMALSTEESERLLAAAAEGGARLGVNHNFTYHPQFARLLRDVEAGKIGRVQHVVSVQNNPLRQLAAGDVGHWMFEHPRNIVFEQGPHPISQLVRLLGPVRTARVATDGKYHFPGGRVFLDSWFATLGFENATAQLFLAFGRDFPESWVYVVGTDGAIRADLLHGSYSLHEKTRWPDFYESTLTNWRDGKGALRAAFGAFGGYVFPLLKLASRRDPFFVGMKGSLAGFHRALRDGSRLPVSGEDGLAVVQACERVTALAVETLARSAAPTSPAILEYSEPRTGEVTVLGATGFIGGHVVERLIAAGRPVRILARNPSVIGAHLRHPKVRFVKGNSSDEAALSRAIEGAEQVVHLAWGGGDSFADFQRNIVEADERVAQMCLRHGVKRFHYTSTIAVLYLGPGAGYASVEEQTPVDRTPEKRSHYARAKIESERRLQELAKSKGLPLVLFRPAVVVGERGRPFHSAVGTFPRDAHCLGWGSGTNPLPFVLAEDVADAIVRALDAPAAVGGVFNLVGDVRLTAREYMAEMAKHTQRPLVYHPTPLWLTQICDLFKWGVKVVIRKPENAFPSWRDLATRSMVVPIDCSAAKRKLGWAPCADRARFIERGIAAALAPTMRSRGGDL